jgi:hypothetical protein
MSRAAPQKGSGSNSSDFLTLLKFSNQIPHIAGFLEPTANTVMGKDFNTDFLLKTGGEQAVRPRINRETIGKKRTKKILFLV